jgi:hypothetical protein
MVSAGGEGGMVEEFFKSVKQIFVIPKTICRGIP